MNKEEKREMEILRSDNTSLAKEIESLKQKINGYVTSNNNYRKQVAELKERVEHYKKLDLEGDKLYEGKIAELDATEKSLRAEIKAIAQQRDEAKKEHKAANEELSAVNKKVEDQNAEIKRLSDLVDTEREKSADLSSRLKAMTDKYQEAEYLVEVHNSKPWYKRIAKI